MYVCYVWYLFAFEFLLNTAPTTTTTTTSKKDATTTIGMVIAVMIPAFRGEESLRAEVTVTELSTMDPPEQRIICVYIPARAHNDGYACIHVYLLLWWE